MNVHELLPVALVIGIIQIREKTRLTWQSGKVQKIYKSTIIVRSFSNLMSQVEQQPVLEGGHWC